MKVASSQSPLYNLKVGSIFLCLFLYILLEYSRSSDCEVELCIDTVGSASDFPDKRNKMIKRNLFRLVCVKVNEVLKDSNDSKTHCRSNA